MESNIGKYCVEIKNALAKSNGVNLIKHNKNVSATGVYIAKTILGISNSEILEIIRITGILHDIAKISEGFQEFLKRKIKKTNHKFRHNELGGAFIHKYFNSKNINIDYISNSVYWHHGIINKMKNNYYDEVIDDVNDNEIEMLKEIVVELLDDSYLLPEPRTGNTRTPQFYYDNEEYNEIMSIVRTCVISADRIVSMLEEKNHNLLITENNISNILDKVLNDKINKNNSHIINKSPYQPEERFNKQLEIEKNCGQTTIVKAPAGFGKTMVALIWAFVSKRKTLWVCPRNVVAESVYESILEELRVLGFNDVTVELYLTGKVEQKNHNNVDEFNSDIIVTNIDNFLSPSVTDNIADRLFLTHSANIVFDEYQEFITDEPYFACFINLMRARHRNTESRTLLLSATPVNISYFWDTIKRKTIILPNDNSHYSAIHDKKYLIRVTDGLEYYIGNSNIIIFNSIAESQFFKNKLPDSLLFHSEFESVEKHKRFKGIMTDFGKTSARTLNKQTIVATIIARASFDVSFHNLYESCQSPESTLQGIGRCDRFGDYEEESIITIFKLKNRNGNGKYSRSEEAVIDIHYNKDLMNKWFDALLPYDGKRLTLNEIYVIYNEHVLKYEKERKKYFDKRYRASLKLLNDVYPIKFESKKKQTEIITAGSNKLRSTGNEIFFLVQYYNDDKKYVGPFSTVIYKTISEDFHEEGRTIARILGSMNTIMKTNPNGFDYTEILDNQKTITLEDIQKYGKKSNTPYIRYDKVYHPDYGLITIENLAEILL